MKIGETLSSNVWKKRFAWFPVNDWGSDDILWLQFVWAKKGAFGCGEIYSAVDENEKERKEKEYRKKHPYKGDNSPLGPTGMAG